MNSCIEKYWDFLVKHSRDPLVRQRKAQHDIDVRSNRIFYLEVFGNTFEDSMELKALREIQTYAKRQYGKIYKGNK